METDNRPLLLQKEIRINGYDIDFMGIVSNIVYVRWFEDLRTHFLEVYYPLENFLKNNQCPTVIRTEIDYKIPLTVNHKPMGRIWLNEVSKARLRVGLEIVTGNKVHATGLQTGTILDLTTRRPVKVPEEFKELFDKAP
jgi:acyl-CoA thioester hydrolase